MIDQKAIEACRTERDVYRLYGRRKPWSFDETLSTWGLAYFGIWAVIDTGWHQVSVSRWFFGWWMLAAVLTLVAAQFSTFLWRRSIPPAVKASAEYVRARNARRDAEAAEAKARAQLGDHA